MKISDITVEDSENRKKRSLNIEDVYVTPQKNVSETFNEKAIDNFNDSFYLDSESLEYYDDEQMNEQMKKYLDNVDYDKPDFFPAKRPMFIREGISEKELTSVVQSKSSPVIIEEKQAKYTKFRTVIDLTDDFNPREYIEEVQCVVEVIDLSK